MAELDLTGVRPQHRVAWAKRAILLVDVVGSVGLVDQDEVGVISDWLDFVERVKRDILPTHKGRFVKSLGDRLVAVATTSRMQACWEPAVQKSVVVSCVLILLTDYILSSLLL